MELQKYFGDDFMRDTVEEIAPVINKYKNASNATKLELFTPNLFELEIRRKVDEDLLNIIEEDSLKIENLEQKVQDYKDKHGELDKELINDDKKKVLIVRENRDIAKIRLAKYFVEQKKNKNNNKN